MHPRCAWWIYLSVAVYRGAGPSGQGAQALKPKAGNSHPLAVAAAAGDTAGMQQLLGGSGAGRPIGEPLYIDEPSAFGMTALHLAAARDHADAVSLLLRHAASVNARNARGWTPLHLAASRGSEKAAEQLLLGGSDIFALDPDGHTASDVATAEGHAALAATLQRPERVGTTASSPAAAADDRPTANEWAFAEREERQRRQDSIRLGQQPDVDVNSHLLRDLSPITQPSGDSIGGGQPLPPPPPPPPPPPQPPPPPPPQPEKDSQSGLRRMTPVERKTFLPAVPDSHMHTVHVHQNADGGEIGITTLPTHAAARPLHPWERMHQKVDKWFDKAATAKLSASQPDARDVGGVDAGRSAGEARRRPFPLRGSGDVVHKQHEHHREIPPELVRQTIKRSIAVYSW